MENRSQKISKRLKESKSKKFDYDTKYTFIRIGSANAVWQNNKRAPAKRGIWALPKIAGTQELLYMGMSGFFLTNKSDQRTIAYNQANKDKGIVSALDVPIKLLKDRNLVKYIKLKPTDEIWHRFSKTHDWTKTLVREYWKNLESDLFYYDRHSNFNKQLVRDPEQMEVFIES